MKKLMSLLLTAALLLSGLALLASCAHTCTFATAWSSDANDHWHACEDKDCTEVADKAAHTWNDGEITTKATQEAAGVKTYTCTVCSATKTEDVAFTGLTAEEWAAAINAEVFKNVTYTMVNKATMMGQESFSTIVCKITPEKIYTATYTGDTKIQEILDEGAEEVAEMAAEMAETFKHADYVYDAEAKVYKSKDGKTIDLDGMELSNVTLEFENGKLAEFKYTAQMSEGSMSVELSSTMTFSDYGSTVITETVAPAGLTVEEWNAAINAEVFKNVTYSMVSVATFMGYQSSSTMLYKITPNKMYAAMYSGNTKVDEMMTVNTQEIADMAAEMASTFKYEDFEYDAEENLYKAKNGKTIGPDGMNADNATLKFENGKLVEFAFTSQESEGGQTIEIVSVMLFTDYGTTVITETVAE